MNTAENPLTSEKYVYLMSEYSTEGIWSRKRGPCSVECLPVSPDVWDMLRGWQAWYEFDVTCEEHRWFDAQAQAAFGLFISRIVKSQLPDWTVMFFDWLLENGSSNPRKIEVEE